MSVKSTIVILGLVFLCMMVLLPGFVRIQGRRQSELAILEEKLREGYVPVAIPETPVLVRGILYSETKASAVLGDKRKIVYEKDMIQGVTIIKIHKDKVEFAKNDQRWSQKVGEIPKAHWIGLDTRVKMSGKSTIVILSLISLCMMVFGPGFVRIQRRRQSELAVLEEKLKESYMPVAIPETSGLVRGILYSETKPFIVLGDKERIVYEKDTIQGVTMIKIHKDKVEFAENDQRWTQKVGEIPKAHWK